MLKPPRYPVYTSLEERVASVAKLREDADGYRDVADDFLAQGYITLAHFANLLAEEHAALAEELEGLR